MSFRASLTRRALAAAFAVAVIGTTVAAPIADAAPALALKDEDDHDDGGVVGSIPIIGEVVGAMEDASPAEIAVGSVQLASEAANTVVPMIVDGFRR